MMRPHDGDPDLTWILDKGSLDVIFERKLKDKLELVYHESVCVCRHVMKGNFKEVKR